MYQNKARLSSKKRVKTQKHIGFCVFSPISYNLNGVQKHESLGSDYHAHDPGSRRVHHHNNSAQRIEIAGGSRSQLRAWQDRRQDRVSAQSLAGSPADRSLSSGPGGIAGGSWTSSRIDRARDRTDCSAQTVQLVVRKPSKIRPKINVFDTFESFDSFEYVFQRKKTT